MSLWKALYQTLLICKKGWRTPTKNCSNSLGGAAECSSAGSHRLVLVFQVKENGMPKYFKEQFSAIFPYRTRLVSGRGIRRGDHNHHQVTLSSFVNCSAVNWNLLPVSIRNSLTQTQIKNRLKNWIKINVPI